MPVYDYRCKECGTTHEIEHGVNDERPTKCPACGGQLQRVFYPVGVVFKGSGFHKTDYAGKAAQKAGESAPATSEGGAPAKGDGGATTAKPSETASAPKGEVKPAPAAPASKPKPDAKPGGKGS
jgi:putative FmdB family regulatory protein